MSLTLWGKLWGRAVHTKRFRSQEVFTCRFCLRPVQKLKEKVKELAFLSYQRLSKLVCCPQKTSSTTVFARINGAVFTSKQAKNKSYRYLSHNAEKQFASLLRKVSTMYSLFVYLLRFRRVERIVFTGLMDLSFITDVDRQLSFVDIFVTDSQWCFFSLDVFH